MVEGQGGELLRVVDIMISELDILHSPLSENLWNSHAELISALLFIGLRKP